jgi:hypothetical protein
MAKTIIIIEDIDTKIERFDVKVLKFQTPEELATADTPAIVVGNEVASVLTNVMVKLNANMTALPMPSAAHH